MAWIYLAASEGLLSHWNPGYDRSPTVRTIDMHKPFSCPECEREEFLSPRFGMTCGLSGGTNYPDAWTSSMVDSPARTSALQELERAWGESDPDSWSNYSALLASASPDSSSWRTYQLSLLGGLTEYSWDSMRWGMMRDGQLSQPAKWVPFILENDGTYLPTPTACDYGKNVGRKSDGITPSGRDRWSLTVRARRGELPGHPKGVLNPEWIEQAMGFPIGWTAIEDWATPFIQKQREKHSCA